MKNLSKVKKDKKTGLDKQSLIVLSFVALIVIGVLVIQMDKILPNSFGVNQDEGLPNELICMVNDAYMGVEQFPVPVNNKTYYGCCEMCVSKLQNERTARIAIDQFSGEEVDKSEAFIVLKSAGSDQVLYFKTRENYLEYKKGI